MLIYPYWQFQSLNDFVSMRKLEEYDVSVIYLLFNVKQISQQNLLGCVLSGIVDACTGVIFVHDLIADFLAVYV